MGADYERLFGVVVGKEFIPDEVKRYADPFNRDDQFNEKRVVLSEQLRGWMRWSPRFLTEALFYYPYCIQNNAMTKAPILGRPEINDEFIPQIPIIPYEEIIVEDLLSDPKWREFLTSYQLSRTNLISVLKQILIPLHRFVPILAAADFAKFAEDMKISRYKVALSLVPDIQNEEVEELFFFIKSREELLKEVG